jgi:hypothetical protein
MTDTFLTSGISNLVIPKLHDDRMNWADYKLCTRRAMGSKGLVVHLEGYALILAPFQGGGRMGILHLTSVFIFQQPIDPSLLPNAVCLNHVLCFLGDCVKM